MCLSRFLFDAYPKWIQSAEGKLQLFYQMDREKSITLTFPYIVHIWRHLWKLITSLLEFSCLRETKSLSKYDMKTNLETRSEYWKKFTTLMISISLDFRHYISSPKTSYSKTSWSFSARDPHVKHQNYSDQTNLEWKTCFGLLTVLSSRKT